MNEYFISVPIGTKYIKLGYMVNEEIEYIDVHFIEGEIYWGVTCIADTVCNTITNQNIDSNVIKSTIDIEGIRLELTIVRHSIGYVIGLK